MKSFKCLLFGVLMSCSTLTFAQGFISYEVAVTNNIKSKANPEATRASVTVLSRGALVGCNGGQYTIEGLKNFHKESFNIGVQGRVTCAAQDTSFTVPKYSETLTVKPTIKAGPTQLAYTFHLMNKGVTVHRCSVLKAFNKEPKATVSITINADRSFKNEISCS